MFLSLHSVPRSHLASLALWLLCVCLRYGLGRARGDRPLRAFLCSALASLGRWTNWFQVLIIWGAYFTTFDWLLSTSHYRFVPSACPRATLAPASSRRFAGYQPKGPPGRVVLGSVSKSDCAVADQWCNVSPRGDAQSAQTRLRVRDRETERIHR